MNAFSAPHLLRYPDQTITLPLRLFPGVDYYRAMASYGRAVIDPSQRYDKRDKATHRFVIADTRGPLALTVPIVKPDFSRRPSWNQVALSTHGDWTVKHMTALESAYGRTPYFEFYVDRFRPLFAADAPERYESVADYCKAANGAVCRILGINEPIYAPAAEVPSEARQTPPAATYGDAVQADDTPYRQIRQDSLGFLPGMSILDLIFNLGPQAPLYLGGRLG